MLTPLRKTLTSLSSKSLVSISKSSKASVCNRSYSVIAVKRLVYERRLNLLTGLLCVKIQSLFYHVSVGSSDIYRRSHCYSPTDWHH